MPSIVLAECPPEQLELINAGFCGARTRNVLAKGPYCRMPAGKRTDHFGEGRCWLHGGSSRTTTGKYSSVLKTELADAIAEQEENPAIYDTTSEIAALRAIVSDYLNRYDAYTAALFAWHQSYGPSAPNGLMLENLNIILQHLRAELSPAELQQHQPYKVLTAWYEANKRLNPKPTQLIDISEVYKMMGEVTKMVERVGKLNAQQAISRKDFVRIMTEIGNIIDQMVPDDSIKAKIKSKIGSMRLA